MDSTTLPIPTDARIDPELGARTSLYEALQRTGEVRFAANRCALCCTCGQPLNIVSLERFFCHPGGMCSREFLDARNEFRLHPR